MAERKLPIRRRRASKGQNIRVSDLVYGALDRWRKGSSWDVFFRRIFGFPDRAGNEQPLVEGMLEAHTGRLLLKTEAITWSQLEENAYEIAFMAAAKQGAKRVSRPIRMRELV